MGNQYFQVVFHDQNAFLKFYPPTDGGTMLKANEVTSYLDFRRFNQYDIKQIGAAIANVEEATEVPIGAWDGVPVHEGIDVSVSLDKMKAVCRFYPPSEGGKNKTAEDIKSDLNFNRVKFGIDDEQINKFLSEHHYCTDYVLAVGKAPVHGKDAKIEYFFNTNLNLQPKRNEDGSVDYKELNTISHIAKGDLLARLIKEDPGASGSNIFGDEIKPRTVKSAKLEYGNKISINEDKTEIYSDVTGHASLTNGKVFVSDVYEVPADVDNSTGNIEYDGSVQIRGNVKAGFSVRAKGDIIVEGVVESATLEADGQIIVKSGIHGMHKGVLKAGTNIMVKYIENATVTAGGYVEAEMILNSTVSANNAVKAKGRKGLINGGVVRAGNVIEADNLGTEMGTPTELEVGIEPETKMRYIEVSKYIEKEAKELEDLKVIVTNYGKKITAGERLPQDKLMYVQKMAIEYKQRQAALEPVREELHGLRMKMMAAEHAYVEVKNKAYPGVTLAISDLTLHIKNITQFSRFKKVEGEIKAVSM